MSWAIEELVEDAIVSYLRKNVTGDLRVYAAGIEDEITLPACVVLCGDGQNVNENELLTGRRQFDVTIEVRCEAAPLKDDSGTTILTARERFRQLRDSVAEPLFDNALHSALNAISPNLVLFSMAYLNGTTARRIEERDFVASWTLEVIAQGVAP